MLARFAWPGRRTRASQASAASTRSSRSPPAGARPSLRAFSTSALKCARRTPSARRLIVVGGSVSARAAVSTPDGPPTASNASCAGATARGLRRLGCHARHLLRLGPADPAGRDGLAQGRQALEVIGQPLELVVAVVAEAQLTGGVELQTGVAELPVQRAARHLGEPQHGAFGQAQGGHGGQPFGEEGSTCVMAK